MTDPKVNAEAERLFSESHAAYVTLGRAQRAGTPEKRLEDLKTDWQAKHRTWWNYVQREILKKPGIIVSEIDMSGPDPLKD